MFIFVRESFGTDVCTRVPHAEFDASRTYMCVRQFVMEHATIRYLDIVERSVDSGVHTLRDSGRDEFSCVSEKIVPTAIQTDSRSRHD